MTDRSTTITDVAKQAGVAKATVSLVMRSKPGISDATRQRVLQAARELNYRPTPSRQTRGGQHAGQIALLLVTTDMPRLGRQRGGSYLHHMLDGCLLTAEAAGMGVVVCKMTADEVDAGRFPHILQRGNLDGLLVRAPVCPALRQLLAQLACPLVYLDCDRHVTGAAQVQIENLAAMDRVVEHLLEQGCRRPAVITGDMDHLNAQERLAGMQIALQRRGHTLPDARIVMEHGFDETSGWRGVELLAQRDVAYDALVCQNDLIALGALRKLKALGRSVPTDVRLCGFDDMEFCADLETPLTTVRTRCDEMGRLAAQLLLEQTTAAGSRPLQVRVPADLIVRASTLG